MLTPKAVKHFFSTKLALGILAVVLLFLVFQFSQVFYQRYSTDKEINDYHDEIGKLESQQKRLNDAMAFLNTDFFAEREARTKLGLQKPGEQIVVVPEDQLATPKSEATEKAPKKAPRLAGLPTVTTTSSDGVTTPVEQKNPTQWWGYFFGDN